MQGPWSWSWCCSPVKVAPVAGESSGGARISSPVHQCLVEKARKSTQLTRSKRAAADCFLATFRPVVGQVRRSRRHFAIASPADPLLAGGESVTRRGCCLSLQSHSARLPPTPRLPTVDCQPPRQAKGPSLVSLSWHELGRSFSVPVWRVSGSKRHSAHSSPHKANQPLPPF
jgi:hypothetical protein